MGETLPVEADLRSLMLASLDGDAAQYRILLKELSELLRRYVARRLPPGQAANAEDIVQDCLMAIHARRMTYDRDRPFTAWAYAIARYKLIDHFRRSRVTVPIEDDDALLGFDDEEKVSARLDVEGLLKAMPAATGALIREVQIEGQSIAEAARRAHISETAAKVRIHRGLKALATMIAGGQDDMTDELIDRLSHDLKPVGRGAMLGRLAGPVIAGIVIAAAIMIPWIGLRRDFSTAWTDAVFWLKSAYPLGLALFGYWTALRLARPDGSSGWGPRLALSLIGLLAIGAVVQLLLALPDERMALVVGRTALVCPFYITALSLPIFAATFWAMRRMAPTDLTMAGLVAGFAAGATGAWVYSFHCIESGLPFVTLWYTLGVLLVTMLGALAGRYLLRW